VIWTVTIPGQPLSYNASLEIHRFNRRAFNRGGGEFRTIGTKKAAKDYTQRVADTIAIEPNRPRGWQPTGFVVVEYYYFLGRWVDPDNVMKLVNDGLKRAIGVDDKWFLPRAMWMMTGLRPESRRIVLRIGELEDFASSLPEPLRSTLPQTTSSTS